jgi:transposase
MLNGSPPAFDRRLIAGQSGCRRNIMQVRNYELLAPMDVDKKGIHLVIMNQDRVLRKIRLPYGGANIFNYVEKKFPGEKVLFAYEAGPTGYGLYDYLVSKGKDCVIAVPSMIPRAPGQRVKTNRLDADRLGHQLKTGDLRCIQVPEEEYRDLRHLTRLRWSYSRGLIATKQRLKGLLLFEEISFPEGKWSTRLRRELQGIDVRPELTFKIKQLLKDYEFYSNQELLTRSEIRRFCRANQELNSSITYLMTIKGVGWIVSSYFLAAVGGPNHLLSVARTCSFFGLGLKENSTGEKVRRGSITSAGDPYGRRILIQAAWVAIRKDPQLRRCFRTIVYRNPKHIAKQKAIIAVARKLLCRMHAVLREQRNYEVVE